MLSKFKSFKPEPEISKVCQLCFSFPDDWNMYAWQHHFLGCPWNASPWKVYVGHFHTAPGPLAVRNGCWPCALCSLKRKSALNSLFLVGMPKLLWYTLIHPLKHTVCFGNFRRDKRVKPVWFNAHHSGLRRIPSQISVVLILLHEKGN